MTPREAAFVSLKKYENNKKFANIEADVQIRRNGFEGAERALYTALFYGTIERRITLDYFIDRLSERAPSSIDENVRIILRLSLYQMRYMDRVPDYAVLSEAGELCKRFAAMRSAAFVNAVLRAYQNAAGENASAANPANDALLRYPDRKTHPVQYLSVRYSYPEWLCRFWIDCYGIQKTEAIFRAFENIPTITLRTNTLLTTTDAMLALLSEHGVVCAKTAYAENGIRLTSHYAFPEIPGASDRLWFVQDEASQLAVSVLAPQPGETIIDACAAPGGKSFSTAMWMNNQGRIYSFDLHANKQKLISDGAEKLGITILESGAWDASEFNPAFHHLADRVLCDVPCSGLGVMAKKPDIRYKEEDDIKRLPEIQYAILKNCSNYVRAGGILAYTTCTLNPEENENNVRRFLSQHPAYRAVPFRVGDKTALDGMMTIFPDEFPGCDGFFIAKMERIG